MLVSVVDEVGTEVRVGRLSDCFCRNLLLR